MHQLRPVLLPALSLVLLLAPATADNQAPSADSGVDLLLKAQLQFQNLDFVSARQTLWQAHHRRGEMTTDQQAMLADLLGEVDQAIARKTVAHNRYNQAVEAMQREQYDAARKGFAEAAECPYLPVSMRSVAREQLASAEMKMAAALAAHGDSPRAVAFHESIGDPAAAQDSPQQVAVEQSGDQPQAEPISTPQAIPANAEENPDEPARLSDESSQDAQVTGQTPATAQSPAGVSGEQARRIQADMLVAKGKDALNSNRAAQAVEYFSRALELDPSNEMIRRQLDFARQMTAQPGGTSILSDYKRQQRIARQIAEHDMQEALNRSMELMSKADSSETFDEAQQAARVARNILENNKRLFEPQEYRERLSKIEDQIRWVEKKQEEWDKQRVRQQITEIEQAERERQQRAIIQRDQKISELTKRAHALRRDRKFSEALDVMQQILQLDPDNAAIADDIYMLRQVIILKRAGNMKDELDLELGKLSVDMRQNEIPWYDKVRWPKDWKELTARRERFGASASSESEEDRALRKKLRDRVPSLEFDNIPFADVVDFLREYSGVNIWVNWRAMEAAGIDRTQPVSVDLTDISLEKGLELILDDVGGGVVEISYNISDGVVTISTREDLNRNTITRVYEIRDLIVRIPNFEGDRVDTGGLGGSTGGTTGGTGGTGGGGGDSLFGDSDSDDGGDGEDEIQTRSEMITQIQDMITTTIDTLSWQSQGGDIGAINEMHGNLVITQTAENHRKIEDLISKLREARTIQIAIEARFISVSTGFLSQIGLDLDFYFNLHSEVPIRPDDPLWGGQANGFSPIAVNNDTLDWVTSGLNSGGLTGGISGGGTPITPSMSIQGTYLDDLQVNFLVQALQAHETTRTLTAPRLTLFNGQRAYVSIAREKAYVSALTPEISENVVAYEAEISYATSGTLLDVDATVSHDRRYVVMTLRPQVVTLENADEITTGGGPEEVNALQGFIGLPEYNIQEIMTTVSVPDGGTLLLGGQYLTGETEVEKGVPVLSKVPVINRAFTNKGKVRDERTLLILVKPQILIQDEMERNPRRYLETEGFPEGFRFVE